MKETSVEQHHKSLIYAQQNKNVARKEQFYHRVAICTLAVWSHGTKTIRMKRPVKVRHTARVEVYDVLFESGSSLVCEAPEAVNCKIYVLHMLLAFLHIEWKEDDPH